MSGINSLPSERAAIIAAYDPDSYGAATGYSDYFDMSLFESAMVLIAVGDFTAGDTCLVSVNQATNSSGGSEKAITSATITLVSDPSPLGKNSQMIINLRSTDFDMDNDFRWGRVKIVTAGGSPEACAVDVCVLVLGFDPKHGPASDNDLSSVVEIVSL